MRGTFNSQDDGRSYGGRGVIQVTVHFNFRSVGAFSSSQKKGEVSWTVGAVVGYGDMIHQGKAFIRDNSLTGLNSPKFKWNMRYACVHHERLEDLEVNRVAIFVQQMDFTGTILVCIQSRKNSPIQRGDIFTSGGLGILIVEEVDIKQSATRCC